MIVIKEDIMEKRDRDWRWRSTSQLAESLLTVKTSDSSLQDPSVQKLITDLQQLVPETVGAKDPVGSCLKALRRIEEDLLNLLRESAEAVLDSIETMKSGEDESINGIRNVGRRMKEFLRITTER